MSAKGGAGHMTQGWFGPVGCVCRKLSGQAEPHPKAPRTEDLVVKG